ncbi:MAG: hypothetical protein HZC28_17025 [Spirochaetes bacterium]|nr:hypothetical protein [Spirochaetota bacterium]
MNAHITEISHKGKAIIKVDYRGLSSEDAVTVMRDLHDTQLARGPVVLTLADVSDSHISELMRTKGMEYAKDIEAKGIQSYMAMIGVSGMQRLIMNAFSRALYFAKDDTDALEWLVKK